MALAALDKDQSIIVKNKGMILAYVKFRDAEGLSVPRQVRYVFTLEKTVATSGKRDVRDCGQIGYH